MTRLRLAVVPLRVFLVLLFGLLLLLQTMSLPGQFAHMAKESPADAHLRWPFLAVSVLVLACVQVVIICTWQLLSMVLEDRIFSERSFRWVDGIVGAVGVGWSLMFGVLLFVGFTADDPGMPLLLTVVVLCGAVFGLLMVVMRALLQQATSLRTDMEAVI